MLKSISYTESVCALIHKNFETLTVEAFLTWQEGQENILWI